MTPILSIIITVKNQSDPKFKQLLKSIEHQDLPEDRYEIIPVSEGTSESAKAIGIRKARAPYLLILASDNYLIGSKFLSEGVGILEDGATHTFPMYYYHRWDDDLLNRYFAMIGGNDPLTLYMRKQDKLPLVNLPYWSDDFTTLGDNGYFIRKDIILQSDMEHYYHVDNCYDVRDKLFGPVMKSPIWHKTGGKIIPFFIKRFRYGVANAYTQHRRWHLVNLKDRKDIARLLWFLFASLTIVEPLLISMRGYRRIPDKAWFLHPMICLLTVLTYTLVAVTILLRRLFRWSSAQGEGRA